MNSPIMRDVDLFVGVTSIGNDRTWADRGEAGFGQYWRSFAFGDLSQSGETRRAILERLLPQLKIASKCALEGKFLVVRGDLRFDGDQTLAIILSKAFLLAADRKITDPTILRQIGNLRH